MFFSLAEVIGYIKPIKTSGYAMAKKQISKKLTQKQIVENIDKKLNLHIQTQEAEKKECELIITERMFGSLQTELPDYYDEKENEHNNGKNKRTKFYKSDTFGAASVVFGIIFISFFGLLGIFYLFGIRF